MNNRRSEQDSSVWGGDEAARYAKVKHGPDGAKFLDPHLQRSLSRAALEQRKFLDIGCGTGPWTEYALRCQVASAAAFDSNAAMVEKARQLLEQEQLLDDRVELLVADASNMPFSDNAFEALLSANVGCNLPDGKFQAHFKEAFRVAETGAKFVVTAPNSLAVTFENESSTGEDIQTLINTAWEKLPADERTSQGAKTLIDTFRQVLRATFVLNAENKPVLVTPENSAALIRPGTPILRRIPGLVVDNNYHDANEYISAATTAGWKIETDGVIQDKFESEAGRLAYNASVEVEKQLGRQYAQYAPFLVLNLKK